MEQENTVTEGTEEAAPTIHELVVSELAKLKEDASYVPALPKGIVLDESYPDGYYMVRPCLEEFVASGYKADNYDSWFSSGDGAVGAWGPGWSNPNWVPGQNELLSSLPEVLVVRSQVRRAATRTMRARSPSRHRFKQFLFGDPSYRLVRNGERQVPSAKVLANLNELIDKETAGLLSVHFIDGRRLNLEFLKGGIVEVEAPVLPAPLPNPPLDSAANDTPAGIPMSTFIDGTFPGDPTAVSTIEQMLKDKAAEQGDLPDGIANVVEALKGAVDAIKAADAAPTDLGDVSDPLSGDGDSTAASEEVATDASVEESSAPAEEAEATEPTVDSETAVLETPVPETVPDVKPVNKQDNKHGKKGNKR
jgi:hypothetical protein